MTQRKHPPSYTAEFRARGVRLFKDNRADYASDNAAYRAIAPKLGCSPDSLRAWRQQADRDAGERSGLTPAVTLVVAPGSYKFGDFIKIDVPLLVLTWIATLLVAPLVFPFA
jgi:transposase-like protein